MNKKQAYQELISDVKNYYTAQDPEHYDESVYLSWYDDCEEINLWTYWQGRGSLNAKIMLVGQDWGSPADASEHYMAQFAEINAGNRLSYYSILKASSSARLWRSSSAPSRAWPFSLF